MFIDGFFSDIISRTPSDVTEVEVNADATWQLRTEQPASSDTGTSQATESTAESIAVWYVVIVGFSHTFAVNVDGAEVISVVCHIVFFSRFVDVFLKNNVSES